MKTPEELEDYEQVKCPYCLVPVYLRAYLFEDEWSSPHYQTSACPRHGEFWMLPELVRVLRLEKSQHITFDEGLL